MYLCLNNEREEEEGTLKEDVCRSFCTWLEATDCYKSDGGLAVFFFRFLILIMTRCGPHVKSMYKLWPCSKESRF